MPTLDRSLRPLGRKSTAEEKKAGPLEFSYIFDVILTTADNISTFMCVNKLKISRICLPLKFKTKDGGLFKSLSPFQLFMLFAYF